MTWDYQYDANGVALSDYMQGVRVTTEYGTADFDDPTYRQPGQHGAVWQAGSLATMGQVIISGVVRDTNASGVVTHTDGRPGHIYENLSTVKRLLGRTDQLITVNRVVPHAGSQRLRVIPQGRPQRVTSRFEVMFPMTAVWPWWEGASVGPVALVNGFTPDGDAPLTNMVVTCPGAVDIDNTRDGSGFATTGACTVTHGSATRRQLSAPAVFTPNDDRWLHLMCGVSNALTITGSPTITYRPQWR